MILRDVDVNVDVWYFPQEYSHRAFRSPSSVALWRAPSRGLSLNRGFTGCSATATAKLPRAVEH